MSQHGWLKVRRVGNRSYYGATNKTRRLLEEGERRIFANRTGPWDHQWRILVYSIPERKRELRTELRKQLAWLGYGPLSSGSWICPHEVESDVRALVDGMGISSCVETFTASHMGISSDRELASRCWDLEGIDRRYQAFVEKYRPLFEELTERRDVADSECFVQRFLLIHEYRKFFFIDPELPAELVPECWHGFAARDLFHAFHDRLADAANSYFDSVFDAPPRRKRLAGLEKAESGRLSA